jgi:N-methylhydantoinase A/oxoprolinase/acetone carboxylase beta subunit
VRSAAPTGARQVWLDGRELRAARYNGLTLAPGDHLVGPGVVDYPGSTVWVPPTTRAQVDGWANLVLDVM